MKKNILIIFLAIFLMASCNRISTSNQKATASISGRILFESSSDLRIYAREVESGQVSWIPGEGKQTYTITDLPAGKYVIVGWYHPFGASCAYTSLDIVVAEGADQMTACEEAIVTIELSPGEDFTGADIGCLGGNFFDLTE